MSLHRSMGVHGRHQKSVCKRLACKRYADRWSERRGIPTDMIRIEGENNCLSFQVSEEGQTYCYPLQYGVGRCSSWDEDRSTYWSFYDLGFHYSYETCGTVNNFLIDRSLSSLRGGTLRVGVPRDEPPYLLRDPEMGVAGIVPSFLELLAYTLNFKIEYMPVYDDSLAKHPESSYTACVLDVALKRFHTCAGVFWETPQRRKLVEFSPILFPDLFFLVTFKHRQEYSFIVHVNKVFRPFTTGLWACLLGISMLIGFFLWLFGEYSDKHPFSANLMCVNLALLKCMNQTGWGRLKTVGSGVLAIGFAFVCMVSMCSYTAKLAAFLVREDWSSDIIDIDDAISKKTNICVLEVLKEPIIGLYPAGRSLYVFTGWYDESLEKMESGECAAMLLNENEISRMKGAEDFYGRGDHCNKGKVGDVVLAIPAAIPLNKEIAFPMSFSITDLTVKGRYTAITNAQTNHWDVCRGSNQIENARGQVTALEPNDLTGAFFVTFVCMLVALVLHFFEPWLENRICGKGSKVLRVLHETREIGHTHQLDTWRTDPSLSHTHSGADSRAEPGLSMGSEIPIPQQSTIQSMLASAAHLQQGLLDMHRELHGDPGLSTTQGECSTASVLGRGTSQ